MTLPETTFRPAGADAAAEWDALVTAAPDGHLLQSYAWGEFKARHGWEVQRFRAEAGGGFAAAQVLWRESPLGAMGYIPRGPVVVPPTNEEALRDLMFAVHREGRARKAVFLKAEPNARDPGPLPRLGFRTSVQTVQPRCTLIIDLRQSLEAIRSRQHSKTRYNIQLAARKGVRVIKGGPDDVPTFCSLMMETGERDGFAARTPSYYEDAIRLLGDRVDLLLAEHEGDVIAGLLLTRFNGEAIYLYGASSSHKRNLMATYLLQWEAISRAREQGMQRYDFWAVPPELAPEADALAESDGSADKLPPFREHESGADLWGVYRFKRGFGGKLVAYSGAYDYVYSSARYQLWQHMVPRALSVIRRNRRLDRVVSAVLGDRLSGQ
jgi:lipid II:glycine glycyltransferase (peptidoglycan interpeptide bridge formation enzyme)